MRSAIDTHGKVDQFYTHVDRDTADRRLAAKQQKMATHFELEIGGANFSFRRKTAQIATEAALDGLWCAPAAEDRA